MSNKTCRKNIGLVGYNTPCKIQNFKNIKENKTLNRITPSSAPHPPQLEKL